MTRMLKQAPIALGRGRAVRVELARSPGSRPRCGGWRRWCRRRGARRGVRRGRRGGRQRAAGSRLDDGGPLRRRRSCRGSRCLEQDRRRRCWPGTRPEAGRAGREHAGVRDRAGARADEPRRRDAVTAGRGRDRMRSAAGAPVSAEGRLWGVVIVGVGAAERAAVRYRAPAGRVHRARRRRDRQRRGAGGAGCLPCPHRRRG